MRRRSTSWVLVLGLLSCATIYACKRKAPPSDDTAPKIVAEPKASTGASASVEAPTFHLVAMRDGPLSIDTLDDGSVIVNGGVAYAIARPGGELVYDRASLRGIAPRLGGSTATATTHFGGRFPDSAWLVDRIDYMRGTTNYDVYRWQSDHWGSVTNAEGYLEWFYAGFSAFGEGRTLALKDHDVLDLGVESESKGPQIEAAIKKARPTFEIPGSTAASALPIIPDGFVVSTFEALPSGEVFAVLTATEGNAPPSFARWGAGTSKAIVESLPAATDLFGGRLVVHRSDDVYLAGGVSQGADSEGKPYLAHFDGKAWKTLDAPTTHSILAAAIGADGALWLASGGEVLRRGDGGGWKHIALRDLKFPRDGAPRVNYSVESGTFVSTFDEKLAKASWKLQPYDVLEAEGDVWIAATAEVQGEGNDGPPFGRSVVLRTRRPASVTVLPDPDFLSLEISDFAPLKVATAGTGNGCYGYYLVMDRVPEGAPDGYDPVALRGAIVDDPAVSDPNIFFGEAAMRGERSIGAFAASCDAECVKEMRHLSTTIHAALPDHQPQAYCRTPLMRREITFAKK